MCKDKVKNFPLAYGIRTKNEEILKTSSSGGIFSELANYALKNNIKIYSCILNEKLEAVHIRGINENDIKKMRTSKYVESSLGNILKLMKNDIKNNEKIMLVSSPCYVATIKKTFSESERNQIIWVDFLCHGMPSKKVFQDHIKYLENLYSSKVIFYSFRDKRYSWNHDEYIILENKKRKQSVKEVHRYKRLFYLNYSLLSRCFQCKYTKIKRDTDITIADFWGVESVLGIVDNKGMSAVLINSVKGKEILEKIKNSLYTYKVNIEDFKHGPLYQPTEKPKDYDLFWKEYKEKGYLYVSDKYTKIDAKTIFSTYRRRIAAVLKIEHFLFWIKYKLKRK